VRIALVGTDLAPVREGAGALETLLAGWAAALAPHHDIHVLSRPDGTAAPPHAGSSRRDSPPAVDHHAFDAPADLEEIVGQLAPDAVVLNNRPRWQQWVHAPTLHLFHNWPDAWGLRGEQVAAHVGTAGAAAVSGPLAAVVASALGRPAGAVPVVHPFAGPAFLAARPTPEDGIVLAPNRLMEKKGIRQLLAASREDALRGRRILVSNFISPWTRPTAEHIELQALVAAAPGCELVDPPGSRPAMAALYARATVVVVPSVRPEGLGMTAVESQAVGVPVVTSGLGGLAEAALRPDLVADPHDPAALAGAIVRGAALGPADRAALRAEIARRFSLDASRRSLLAAVERARPA
jgi:glycosyltransferase involved in cell wall biosynthesis